MPISPRLALARVAISLSVGIFSQQSFASDRIDCPSEISATSIQLKNTPDGWTPFLPSSLALTAAGFMQAPPEKMAHLKPSSTKENKKRTIVTWKFQGDYPQGKWLTCDYAQGAVSLSKEIDRSTAECSVIYEKKNSGTAGAVRVACK